jgi:glutaredoxin-related protein
VHELPEVEECDLTEVQQLPGNYSKYQSFTASEVLDVCSTCKNETGKDFTELETEIFSMNDSTDAERACHLLSLYSNPMYSRVMATVNPKIWKTTNGERNKYLKALHSNIRATNMLVDGQELTPDESCMAQYLDQLSSRRPTLSKKEQLDDILARTVSPAEHYWLEVVNGVLVKDAQRYQHEFRRTLRDILNEMLATLDFTKLVSKKEYMETLITRTASGAAPGCVLEDGRRADKTSALESGEITAEWLFSGEPICTSSASLKDENGKQRLLIASPIKHYVREDFILQAIEPHCKNLSEWVDEGGPIQSLFEHRTRVDWAQNNTTCSWDYKNFNFLHDISDLCYIWLYLKEQFTARGLDDYADTANWLARCELNTFILFEGVRHKVVRGLGTGRRGTAFINTTQNIAYSRTNQRNMQEMLGYQTVTSSNHKGDDVVAVTNTTLNTIIYYMTMQLSGLEAQTIKLLGSAEFLRYSYHRDGTVQGFLNRSLANLITRDQNRSERKDPLTIGMSFTVQCRKAIRRGGDAIVLKGLKDYRVNRDCILYNENHTKSIPIPLQWWHSHTYNNGCGVMDLNYKYFDAVWNKVPRTVKLPTYLASKFGTHGTNRFLKYISEQMGYSVMTKDISESLANQNYVSILKDNEIAEARALQYAQWCGLRQEGSDSELITQKETLIAMTILKELQEMIAMGTVESVALFKVVNDLSKAKATIPKTIIKRVDVFKYMARLIQDTEPNLSVSTVINRVLTLAKLPLENVQALNLIAAKFGTQFLVEALYDQFTFDNTMEGYFKPELVTVIRQRMIIAWLYESQHYDKADISEATRFMSNIETQIMSLLPKNLYKSFGP